MKTQETLENRVIDRIDEETISRLSKEDQIRLGLVQPKHEAEDFLMNIDAFISFMQELGA